MRRLLLSTALLLLVAASARAAIRTETIEYEHGGKTLSGFVAWDDANVHVLSHGLHYGTGVFEGIRAYATDAGPAVFRHREHYERLHQSASLYSMELPYSVEELQEATRELIRRNGQQSCYIRPLAFRGYGEMGLYAQGAPIETMIATWPWGAYLGEDGKRNGIRAKVSSWRTLSPDSMIPHAKASGQYLNSILAKNETAQAGYDEAIMLDPQGYVAECTGENLFLVRDGKIFTPPTAPVLEGITRDTVTTLANDLGYEVKETAVSRDQLYIADEVFVCGTAAECVALREIDFRVIGEGKMGPVTRAVQKEFQAVIRARHARSDEWLDYIKEPVLSA